MWNAHCVPPSIVSAVNHPHFFTLFLPFLLSSFYVLSLCDSKRTAHLIIPTSFCCVGFFIILEIGKFHIFWEGHKDLTKSPKKILTLLSKLKKWRFHQNFVDFSEYMKFLDFFSFQAPIAELPQFTSTGTPPITLFSYTAVLYLTQFFLYQKPR